MSINMFNQAWHKFFSQAVRSAEHACYTETVQTASLLLWKGSGSNKVLLLYIDTT